MIDKKKKPAIVYVESTPNPQKMKFVSNDLLVKNQNYYDFTLDDEFNDFPFVKALFSFPFIEGVFLASNFVTITKIKEIEWDDVYLELREYILNYLQAGQPISLNNEKQLNNKGVEIENDKIKYTSTTTEMDKKIIEILEKYVKPAIEEDGGAIHFKHYIDGVLTLQLSGACQGCPSSNQTLQVGIKQIFEQFMPEVKEIVSI